MRMGNLRIDAKSAGIGAIAMLALCTVPKISDFVSPIVAKIRNTIGGK